MKPSEEYNASNEEQSPSSTDEDNLFGKSLFVATVWLLFLAFFFFVVGLVVRAASYAWKGILEFAS